MKQKQSKQCENHNTYEFVDTEKNVWKYPTSLVSITASTTKCPQCKSPLGEGYSLIITGINKAVKVKGPECPICKVLYVFDKAHIFSLLKDNPYEKRVTLDGENLWDYTEREKAKQIKRDLTKGLQSIKSSSCAMHIVVGEREQYFIITTNKYDCNSEIANMEVRYYESFEARELLTAAYHPERNKAGAFGVERFYVTSKLDRYENMMAFNPIIPNTIILQKGGGYFKANPKQEEELVHLLLYSPFTKRYEIINATYNHNTRECYIDYKRFRDFAYKYGNPGLPIRCTEAGQGWCLKDISEWNDESILKACGYSVDQASNKSAEERQQILKDIVDLQILPIPKIVDYLQSFISVHPGDKYYRARSKWQRDMTAISDYKFNPERFLIAELRKPRKTLYD